VCRFPFQGRRIKDVWICYSIAEIIQYQNSWGGRVSESILYHTSVAGGGSEKKIEEMKNLINNKWDWQVRQMDVNEFVIVFPDKGTFDTFSKISEILMNVHGIKVKILKSNMDPDAVEMLQAT
jgi:hypothetical protein